MRSSIADYEVIEELPQTRTGLSRYLCTPPERLDYPDPVVVVELAVNASGWRNLADQLSQIATIESPYLLSVIEAGPDLDPAGAGVYLSMESAPEGSLATAPQALSREAIIEAVVAAARGAHQLHEVGIAHGGICGEAIVFTGRGPALAPPPLGAPAGLITVAHGWRELVDIDPALLRGVEPSRSSDVWALAATLHVLLSEKPLYPDVTEDVAVTALQRVALTRPVVDTELPEGLGKIIGSCFDADAAARPTTAAALADALSGVSL